MASSGNLQIHSLASGSSGNAMLVQTGNTNVLIDAGVPARVLVAGLARHRVAASDLHGILLTHEHSDHSLSAGVMSRRSRAPIITNTATAAAFTERDAAGFEFFELKTMACISLGDLHIRSFPVSHDAAEPVGFVLDDGRTTLTYATDTGCVTEELQEALRGAHIAIVEANHDVDWLWRGSYTPEMKARVASNTGHLSNVACAELLAYRLEAEGPLSVWLAHLSRANNSPALAKREVLKAISRRTQVPVKVEVALRDHPSLSWRSGQQSIQLPLW